MTRMLTLLTGLFIALASTLSAAERVTVFAAASLRGALDEISTLYDAPVALSFGGSGAMARQIATGAPADLVVLANPVWMDWLQSRGVIEPGTARTVAGNQLVVISHAHSGPIRPDDLPGLLGPDRLAIGHRDAVPAGSYAREWMINTGLWDHLESHLAETDNVRSALALVARGETPFGVVYATDAQAEPKVTIVYEIPTTSHSPILYPAAALTPAGAAFLDHLTGPAARHVFEAYGYRQVTP